MLMRTTLANCMPSMDTRICSTNLSPEHFEHDWEGQECSKSWSKKTRNDFCNELSNQTLAGRSRGAARSAFLFTGGAAHLPQGPYRFALHLVNRRGMPRKRRERYEMDSPACGIPYDIRINEARRLYWQVPTKRPACKSSISCMAKSRRRRAHTVSIGFRSPLFGGNFTDVMPCFLFTAG